MRRTRNGRNQSLGNGIDTVPVLPGRRAIGEVVETFEHDLEDHIEILRELDEQRKESAELRDYGIKLLKEWITIEHRKRLASPNHNATLSNADASIYARVVGTLYCYSRTSRYDQELLDILKNFCDRFIEDLERPVSETKSNYPFLEKIKTHHLSVLFAAELMQALEVAPGRSYSTPTLLCYYWVTREIHTADAPGWNVGGARAAALGIETAYVTAQCVIAFTRFMRAQADTAGFVECFRSYRMQLQRFASNPVIPNKWKEQEKKRLDLSCYVTLQQCSKALALPIERRSKNESMEDWVEKTIKGLKGIVETVAKEFHRAVYEVQEFRDWEEKSARMPEEEKTLSRSRFGHDRALSALEEGKERAQSALKLSEDLGTGDQIIKSLQDLQDILVRARQGVRSILQPAENFLSSVLDHELAAATLGHDSTWEPHQVAFAASSLGIIAKRWREDKRLPEALGYLTRAISDRGRFSIGQPFHSDKSAMHFIYPGFVTTALAELLRNVRYPEVEPNLVKKMLQFFDDTRVRQAGIDKETRDLENKMDDTQRNLERDGWFNEYDLQPRRFKPWATVVAVCGLAAS